MTTLLKTGKLTVGKFFFTFIMYVFDDGHALPWFDLIIIPYSSIKIDDDVTVAILCIHICTLYFEFACEYWWVEFWMMINTWNCFFIPVILKLTTTLSL